MFDRKQDNTSEISVPSTSHTCNDNLARDGRLVQGIELPWLVRGGSTGIDGFYCAIKDKEDSYRIVKQAVSILPEE